MAAHVYWRINVTAAPTGFVGVAEWKLYDSGSTQIPTTGGTASASTNYPGQSPSLAFDGNASTFWLTNGSAPHFLQYQFASAVDVASISIQNAAAGSGNDQHTAQDFTLDYSDNGTTWTTLYTYKGAGWGSGGRTITFNASNVAVAAPVISWRLLITGTAGSAVAITDWKLFDASSAQIPTTTYSATASSTYTGTAYPPYLAFDGLIGTWWNSNAAPSVPSPQWLRYDFGSSAYVASISIQTRNDGNYNQGPTTFKVQYSLDNGSTWIDAGTYTATTWTSAGQIQTFTGVVGPTPPATQRGNIDYDQIRTTARQGTGTKFQMFGTGTPVAGHAAVYDSSGNVIDGGSAPGSGSVTSVGLTVPAEFSVAGSPVTGSGTLAVTKANETANTVWAGPSSGAAAAPTFRALVVADVPVLTKVNGSNLAVNTANHSDTTPAAVAGATNVRWQSDASGNISACVPAAWTSYTPGVAGGGSMTVSTSNVIYARWAQIGSVLHVNIEWQGTFGGTASSAVTFSLPAPFTGPGTLTGYGHIVGPAAYWAAAVTINGSNAVVNAVGATFSLATTYNVRVSAAYQV